MGRANKVIQLGIAGKIEQIIASGIATAKDIAAKLTADGFMISQPTVSRWLREQKENRREATQKIVREHVEKTVPADLDAVEVMEMQCLTWAREDNDEFASRLAGKRVADHLPVWVDIIMAARVSQYETPEDADNALNKAVKQIMSQCLGWIADDITLQKSRLSAMRMAAMIIDLKLKHAIGGEGGSNIWIGGAEPGTPADSQAPSDKNNPRLLSFPAQEGD
jgi:predicted transcriptional regulator